MAMRRHLLWGSCFSSYGDHASHHASSSSSSHRDEFHLPTHHSLHPFACTRFHLFRHQRYPPSIDDASEPVPPLATDVVEPVPPPYDEVVEDDESEPPHALRDRDSLKFINHMRKITGLSQSNKDWFQAALSLFGMKDLCMTGYITVNHRMLNAFVERWHIETSSFHILLGETSITPDDVSCLPHLLIRGKLLDHGRISKGEALYFMVDYLGVDPETALMNMERTRGAHARFEFLKMAALGDQSIPAHQEIPEEDHAQLDHVEDALSKCHRIVEIT
ncbi:uncharacterized protein LOC127095164 [Lathyrus oleraceus]|uniref:uncharacterized protein LOC127095164 n=1 Tax=Pisum sativum TaxID=3888 RepID=UPI0021D16415|nr:uncharacterized protein LOC127095164 [Pisum sativum]